MPSTSPLDLQTERFQSPKGARLAKQEAEAGILAILSALEQATGGKIVSVGLIEGMPETGPKGQPSELAAVVLKLEV